MARKLGLKFYRTCVKEDLNVSAVFEYLAELSVKKAPNHSAVNSITSGSSPNGAPTSEGESRGEEQKGGKSRRGEQQVTTLILKVDSFYMH